MESTVSCLTTQNKDFSQGLNLNRAARYLIGHRAPYLF